MENLILPTYKAFSGIPLLVYLFVAWGVWPTITLALFGSNGGKLFGFISGICFFIFMCNRLPEALAMFIVIPATILGGALAGVFKTIAK